MKTCVIFAAIILPIFATAQSKSLTSTSKSSGVTRAIDVQSCHATIIDKFDGSVLAPRAENDFKFSGYSATINVNGRPRNFGFSIESYVNVEDVSAIANHYGAAYDNRQKKWMAYYADESDRKVLSPGTRVYQIRATNSEGFAVTVDDVTGDFRLRNRQLSYCLFREKKPCAVMAKSCSYPNPKQIYYLTP